MRRKHVSDLIKIGVVIKGLEKSGFRDHLHINTAGTTEWTKFVKEIENVEFERKNTQLVPMDLSAVGSQDQKFQESCSWCGIYGHMTRHCQKQKLNTCRTNKRVAGLARTTTPKAIPARARGNQTEARAKASLVRANARKKARKERKDLTRWRGTKTNRKHKPVRNAQFGLTRIGITFTNGLTQTGGRVTGAQICGLILRDSKRQDKCHRHSWPRNSSIRHKEEAFQC